MPETTRFRKRQDIWHLRARVEVTWIIFNAAESRRASWKHSDKVRNNLRGASQPLAFFPSAFSVASVSFERSPVSRRGFRRQARLDIHRIRAISRDRDRRPPALGRPARSCSSRSEGERSASMEPAGTQALRFPFYSPLPYANKALIRALRLRS